mgnify:CR=1 FL=1
MSHQRSDESNSPAPPGTRAEPADRRSFLLSAAMYTGLFAAYGFFAALAGRFLFPARPTPKVWLFVAELARFPSGG